ncbi:LlaJI family restriction endonuclease [Clostridium perfringens]|uniref:LlaJI family restriction endonuclease n=1 Tax=Clostridium perfringens TaxID=1502 RepID=UPI0018E418B8|nr:LlaJI family restriction endonuclease [Clostridium perfringens]MBI6079541.1 LlaJI family restriction endonuclease [Clostridium perfringens]MBI6085357.1 LlaJI family restriction endonuclease [Clostridium perfringens]MBI6098984.1 LlaJI family restriction endonuclease [Clostridium perfringens]MDH5078473.1 Type-2 restriction enzyme BsuMI component YdjA [Clostridium perfringens]MDM0446598.1 LlaJI family restriction endonuclease [Clostridium perfringens]
MNNPFQIELENLQLESNYVGIDFDKGNFKVIFPRGYSLSKNTNSDIILLIKVFEKYIRSKKNKAFNNEFHKISTGKEKNFSIINAIWLMKDYEKNGLYKELLPKYKVDKKGVINWPKTIKSIKPYISDNSLVYLDFVIKENKNNLNNIILLTQKYIIEKCINILGWLYPNITISETNRLPYSKNICINLLKKELQLTNVDKTKSLLIHMINFLENDGDEEPKNILKDFKTEYFQNIWEDMLNEVLGNENPSNYYPNAIWEIDNKIIQASNLRPDIILKSNNKIYVIDAKYYKYGLTKNTNHLPQSSDVIKQLIYSEYITTSTGCDSFDAFILPYQSNDSTIFKFVGNATINIDSLKNKKVVCILADTKAIMQKYIQLNDLKYLKDLIVDIIGMQNTNESKEQSSNILIKMK